MQVSVLNWLGVYKNERFVLGGKRKEGGEEAARGRW